MCYNSIEEQNRRVLRGAVPAPAPILLNIACQVVGPRSGRGRSQGIKYSGTPDKASRGHLIGCSRLIILFR